MTTVLDPLGTPNPIYNVSGTGIVDAVAGPSGTPTAIPSVSGETIANITVGTPGDTFVSLPAGRDAGDLVWVAYTAGSNNTIDVVAPSGEMLFGGTASVSKNAGQIFRKIDSASWFRF